ncbi:MAG TPA: hypothetical protein VFV96_07775 [Verrucomicrobiae bacterium]|nr:hypothetical protein [Verrucomicrobiae bacterium]
MLNPPRHLILVEPAAGVRSGHFTEKLKLWAEGSRAAGVKVITLVTWSQIEGPPCRVERVVVAPAMARALGRFVPCRFKAKWAEFWTYLRAGTVSRQTRAPLIGLTASGPMSLAFATHFIRPAKWLQVVMYGGIVMVADQPRLDERRRWEFAALLRRGCILLCNAPVTADVLVREYQAQRFSGAIEYLPDPIFVPDFVRNSSVKKASEPFTLLVSGEENDRRTPLAHLLDAGPKTEIAKLVLHQPGKAEPVLADGRQWVKPSAINVVEVVTDYLVGEPLVRLFASVRCAVIVYAPAFAQGSANFALAVASGTPVLSSRFPYAEDMFRRFGRLGELFHYGESDGFNAALGRIALWGESDWGEFQEARQRFVAEVEYRAVVRRTLELAVKSSPVDQKLN